MTGLILPPVANLFVRVLAATMVVSGALPQSYIVGHAKVYDGDTIRVDNQRIRLWGVDAPELDEFGGIAAMDEMKLIIGNDTVRCLDTGRRSHNRIVGICSTETYPDIGFELIARGRALDCRRYSNGKYRSVEPPSARLTLPAKGYCIK